ncbi:proline-rich proteoglycan 2 isoform X2 [Episyrphus balteatus]|uniref:proline-rich proteoglycan 2 isoform X2 n=1 Tax=Episyrphus balteatus TaxID=286459 RepID=UPI002486BC3D|nr:proline-rich proteoglycan 2 isoform X2 [Episyrphus balteatus]
MSLLRGILLCSIVSLVVSQDYQDFDPSSRSAPPRLRSNVGGGGGGSSEAARAAPVAILKQINRHNEDGSYTYGYEGADGSFKIETKLATGEVKGKYGYVEESGKVRVVEYGANKYGFQPSGEGITVAPPTLVDETTNKNREVPDYEDEIRPNRPYVRPNRPQPAPRPQPRPQPQFPQYDDYEQENRQQQYAPPPQQHSQPAPAPPRLQIPGARQTDVVYSPQQRPARPESQFSQSSFGGDQSNLRLSRPSYAPVPSGNSINHEPIRPVVEPVQFGPRSQPPPPPPQQPSYRAPPPQQSQGRSSPSLLDQLAKDYALPQTDTQPLHDISFGYY